MELKLKPLRTLVKLFYKKTIPQQYWTPDLVKVFADLKLCITSSPILAKSDTTRSTFLKTDWSSEGKGWILMQTSDDKESIKAIKNLASTGICLFDLSKNGARLKHIAFGSRSCTVNKLLSFIYRRSRL